MHKYRAAAKHAAWYDDPDDIPSYNPFKKIRSRSRNASAIINDLESGNPELLRVRSDNQVRNSREIDRRRLNNDRESPKHANTLPNSASGAVDGPTDHQFTSTQDEMISEEPEPYREEQFASNEKVSDEKFQNSTSGTSETVVTPSHPEHEEKDGKPRKRRRGFFSKFKGDKGKDQSDEDGEDGEDEEKKPKQTFTFMSQIRATLFNSWINVLLIAAPVGIAVNYAKIDPVAIFVINFIAIVPLAALLSYATEEIALRTGETLGGLLNATFGNAVELIVSIIALAQDQVLIVKTSLIGSMLSNLLLVMGMCFFFGGLGRLEQNFNVVVAQTASSLLFLAVGSLIIPTAFHSWSGAGERGVAPLSRGTAIILLFVYGCYLFFQLKTHIDVYNKPSEKVAKKTKPGKSRGDANKGIAQLGAAMSASVGGKGAQENPVTEPKDQEEEPQLHIYVAVFTLAASTVIVALCAEYMVNSIDALTERGGISKSFVGLILLPIVGNAAEHATAVTVAVKDKMDLAIGVAVGSSMQIALLVLPFAVVLGWIMGKDDMTLDFDGFQIAVLFVAVLLVNYLIQDGKSHWLEGVLLQTLYLIIAVAAWFYPAKGQ